jgi:hypothetical protein
VYAVVEGHSEERFLKSVIRQHLAASSVWLYPMLVLDGLHLGLALAQREPMRC